MKKVENSIKYWGMYLVLLGLLMLTFPLQVVHSFGYQASEDLWIRMLGMILAVLGTYYVLIGVYRISILYYAKIATHLFGIFCMILLWAMAYADQRIVPTVAIEAAACLWTWVTIKLSVPKFQEDDTIHVSGQSGIEDAGAWRKHQSVEQS